MISCGVKARVFRAGNYAAMYACAPYRHTCRAVVASLPFAPEIVLPTIKNFEKMELGMQEPFGFPTDTKLSHSIDSGP